VIIDNFNVLSTAIAPKQIRYRSLDNSGFHSCKLDGGFKGVGGINPSCVHSCLLNGLYIFGFLPPARNRVRNRVSPKLPGFLIGGKGSLNKPGFWAILNQDAIGIKTLNHFHILSPFIGTFISHINL